MECNYEKAMTKTSQIKAYSLYLRDWTIKEIANEVEKSEPTIRSWEEKWGWRMRKLIELRDIQQEMRTKVDAAREKIIDAATLTVDDIIIRDDNGNPTKVGVEIETVRDLKTVVEILLRAGGVPDKIEEKVTKSVSGEITVKTEAIDPDVAAEVGRLLALKESVSTTESEEE